LTIIIQHTKSAGFFKSEISTFCMLNFSVQESLRINKGLLHHSAAFIAYDIII